MVTKIPVLVPWRTDHASRETNWEHLKKNYWAPMSQYKLFEASDSGEGLFNVSQARNNAAKLAGKWDVAIIADADSYVAPQQLEEAVMLARVTGKLVAAHNGSWQSSSAHVVNGAKSSMLAIGRPLWDQVKGYDERFVGWGCEDGAFWHHCALAAGDPLHLNHGGPVYHIEHERTTTNNVRQLKVLQDETFMRNNALLRSYQRCLTLGSLEEYLRNG